MSDPRVQRIREDHMVGRGSCTTVDEAYSDEELAAELDLDGIDNPLDALNWARDREEMQLEQATNTRWG